MQSLVHDMPPDGAWLRPVGRMYRGYCLRAVRSWPATDDDGPCTEFERWGMDQQAMRPVRDGNDKHCWIRNTYSQSTCRLPSADPRSQFAGRVGRRMFEEFTVLAIKTVAVRNCLFLGPSTRGFFSLRLRFVDKNCGSQVFQSCSYRLENGATAWARAAGNVVGAQAG